jgi:hypothetical protein
MTSVNVTAVTNTVTVTEGDTTVVTVTTAGPQGPGGGGGRSLRSHAGITCHYLDHQPQPRLSPISGAARFRQPRDRW